MGETGPIHFLNLEYFFRLLYEVIVEGRSVGDFGSLVLLAAKVWVAVNIIAYLISFAALAVIIYTTLRIRQIREHEAHLYHVEHPAHAEVKRDHSRWAHIEELINRGHESDWRQAIIEADIMLDDLLTQLGYQGATVGEKLKQVDPSKFASLQNAWDAHRVRNEIAHQGSAFPLSEQLAHRTIKHYEAVMREHGEIS